MEQRTLRCPGCQSPVEVPAFFGVGTLECSVCGAVTDVATGRLVSAAPQHATAAPYPGQGFPAYPPTRKPMRARVVVAIVLAGVAAIVGLGVVGVYAMRSVGEPPEYTKWVPYESPDGLFTARFPAAPTVQATNESGVIVTSTICRLGANHWEVAWFPLPPGADFDFSEGIEEVARDAKGKVTSQITKNFRGLPGHYAEIDHGRMKVQSFLVDQRVWLVASSQNRPEWREFLDGVRLTDKALGIMPLHIEAAGNTSIVTELKVEKNAPAFSVMGGRPPYDFRVTGDLPPGLSVDKRDTETANATLHLVGKPSTPGRYPLTIAVYDKDDRRADAKVAIEVIAMPQPMADFSFVVPYGSRGATQLATGEKLTYPVGISETVVMRCDSKVPGHHVLIRRVFTRPDRVPAWLKFEPTPGGALELRCQFETAGAFEATLELEIEAGTTGYKQTIRPTILFEATTVPDNERPKSVGAGRTTQIKTSLGLQTKVAVNFTPRADQWNRSRPWIVSGDWRIDAEAPVGLAFKPDAKDMSGFPNLVIEGRPTETGTWEFEAIALVTVKYIDGVFEVPHTIKISVGEVPESELPTELAVPRDLVIGAKVNQGFKGYVTYKPERPRSWNFQREWIISGDWDLSDVELAPGLTLERDDTRNGELPHLTLSGPVTEPGEWEFEIRATITIRHISKTYEVKQRIKLTVR